MNNLQTITLNESGITDFAKERNKLLKKAKSKWVLFLDSDETLSEKLKNELSRAIDSKIYNGYYIKRKNYFLGKYSGTDKILRLARRTSGVWTRPVHEAWKVQGETGELNGYIIHNTADTVFVMLQKINSYSTLHAKANKDEGKNTSIIKITLYPVFKFVESIVMGRGLILSMLQSFHSFLSWSKQWNLPRN